MTLAAPSAAQPQQQSMDVNTLFLRLSSFLDRAEGQPVMAAPDPNKPHVFIAVPSGRSMPAAQTMSAMVALTRALTSHGVDGGFGTLAFPDVAEIRNIFLSIWYDKIGTSHLLFVDDDMSFAPELVLDMLAFNKPLVGALCPKRKLPIEFAGRAKAGDCRLIQGFMEVDGIGGAVMLIRRDAVETIIAKFPELIDTGSVKNHAANQLLAEHGVTRLIRGFDHLWVDGEKFSEDLSFCKRWSACGGEIWANITHNVSHIGPHEYTGNYFDKIKEFVTEQKPAAVEEVQPIIVGEQGGVPTDVTEPAAAVRAMSHADLVEFELERANIAIEPAKRKRKRGRPPKVKHTNGAEATP